ncbi:MAG: hypothetical protein H0U59_03735 [Gemmatimonadaceae bacterium]|nr:hypothetical protein [Gemmatimonadaceae bacterium]MDQ3243274.1 hypothetical protein [Gemmatimonadota bacterium]
MSAETKMASLERVALMLVPARDHDALLGDLDEDGRHATRQRFAAIIRVGAATWTEGTIGAALLLAATLFGSHARGGRYGSSPLGP